jgi:hypothetical protein
LRVSHQEGERLVGFYESVFRVRIEGSLEGFFGESVDLMVLFKILGCVWHASHQEGEINP